jgi:hypothetical protein
MDIKDENSKNEPMHYGEVIGSWAFIGANKGLISGYEAFINHAGDDDLIELLEEAVGLMRIEKEELEKLLLDNGIVPPPSLPERPKAKAEEIPFGARFTDPEISAKVSLDTGKGLVACSEMLGQCLREDIALLFEKYHTEKVSFGLKLLRLKKEKGWVIPPPLHLKKV